MTPRTLYNAQRGMYEKWTMENEGEWERTRWLGSVVINPHVKKNIQPKDLCTFPWEKRRRKTNKDYKTVKREAELFKKKMEYNKKLKDNG